MQYWFRKIYKSKKRISSNFWDVIPKNPIREKRLPYSKNTYVPTNQTCFRDVRIKPFRLNDLERSFIQDANSIKPLHKNWIIPVYETLKSIIFKRWDPDKFHVIPHSAGYDSRIISTAIKELAYKHGKEWLGDYLFVECAGEGFEFKEIMRRQGFKNHISIDQNQYYPYSFNQTKYKDRFNGFTAYPVNIWYDPFAYMQSIGRIPKDFQIITGFGAYAEKAVKDWSWKEFFKRNYYYQLGAFNFMGEHIAPFFDTEYFLAISKYAGLRSMRKRTSEIICSVKCRDMANIERPDSAIIHARGVKIINNNLFKQIKSNIVNSNKIEYSAQWAEYSLQSIKKCI